VIDTDTRFRVNLTNQYPAIIIGQLGMINKAGQSWGCSGTVVSRTSVLTNGHCIWNKADNDWYTITGFSPSRDDTAYPYGTWSMDYMTTYTVYTNDGNTDYDFAVITLHADSSNRLIGDRVGYAGYSWTERTDSALQNAVVIGYPCDKQPYGTMWNSGSCSGSYRPREGYSYNVMFDCDTYKCQSGSALLDLTGNGPIVRGVLWGEFTNGYANHGLALRSSHYWFLNTWSNRGSQGTVRVERDYNKCMDMNTSNNNIYMYGDCHSDDNQVFYYDSSTKQIKSPGKPGYCLDHKTDGFYDVYMFPCHGGSNQKWRYSSSSRYVQSEFNDHCLDWNCNNGNLYMNGSHGGSNQRFLFPEDFW